MKLTRLATCAMAAALTVSAAATDMDRKAKVIGTVRTAHAGIAELTCNDAAGWTFRLTASEDRGRDVVTVSATAPDERRPPQFGVFFRVPGAGVQNVWNADYDNDGYHLWPQLWWGSSVVRFKSSLAYNLPVAVGFNSQERAPVAVACSEAADDLEFGLYIDDRTCEAVGRFEFFTRPTAMRSRYEVSVMIDRRNGGFADTVRDSVDWVSGRNAYAAAPVPAAARDPLYSTWYAYLQDVHDRELETEAALAARLGMKTMILDDGWQKVDSRTFYSATGDWMPVKSRFPDMKRHVAKVHAAGLKYMLWLSVPYMGDESKAFAGFRGKFLRYSRESGVGVLDPRFPEVREYLIRTYERVVGEWDFDGVKLDFIDSFRLEGEDPALKDGFAGRDIRSVPEAVDRLMKDVLVRLRKIKPEVLVEFRQRYVGPAIRQYGNMLRAADCTADPTANRRRICGLRLTSGKTAVHSDMLVWSNAETPQGAALPILNALFSTVQYSMVLAKINPEHVGVIRHWIGFSREHREALLEGKFVPHHAENGYTWIEGEGARERVIASYADNALVASGAADRPVFLVNATGGDGVLAELSARPSSVELFDVCGRPAGTAKADRGLVRLPVPASGYAKICW